MSIIAVQIKDNKITIGADSQDSIDNVKENHLGEKLFKAGDDFYLGIAGNAHIGSLLRAFSEQVRPGNTRSQIHEYFKAFEDWAKPFFMSANSEEAQNSDFLGSMSVVMILDNKVYRFFNHFLSVVETYTAIGCGTPVALAMLSTGSTVEEALRATCKVDSFCSGPLQMFQIDLNETEEDVALENLYNILDEDDGTLALKIMKKLSKKNK